MAVGLLVYRRDLPGGRSVMLSIDDLPDGTVVGRLALERRTDAARRIGAEPPIVAEVRGPSRDEVLQSLRLIAESDDELGRRLERWTAERRAEAPPRTGRRVLMGDGEWWSVEWRHEMTQLRNASAPDVERRLFVLFERDGTMRRAELPRGSEAIAESDALRELWKGADDAR